MPHEIPIDMGHKEDCACPICVTFLAVLAEKKINAPFAYIFPFAAKPILLEQGIVSQVGDKFFHGDKQVFFEQPLSVIPSRNDLVQDANRRLQRSPQRVEMVSFDSRMPTNLKYSRKKRKG